MPKMTQRELADLGKKLFASQTKTEIAPSSAPETQAREKLAKQGKAMFAGADAQNTSPKKAAPLFNHNPLLFKGDRELSPPLSEEEGFFDLDNASDGTVLEKQYPSTLSI